MNLYPKHIKSDALSGVVVFLVALPLCLGIALASGAPLFAGIISGVIGGIVVGLLSNSQLSVSGPAAGLTAILFAAISSIGSYEAFLLAVVIAGFLQVVLGLVKAGTISNYLPSNVIEGMLTAIGVIIILKQLPHAIGFDKDNLGNFFYIERKGGGLLTSITDAINYAHPGAIIICVTSLVILIAWNNIEVLKKLKSIPGALVAVIAGVLINEGFIASGSGFAISQDHLVNLPVPANFDAFIGQFTTPDFNAFGNTNVWIVAFTIAAVASIETLLCIEAADKMDPLKRFTNTNTELKAQGVGNMLSGLIGGIPMTSVIVRTSANVNSGGRTKISAIAHGVYLLLAVISIPFLLNKIPLACLAAILLLIGYKLASPQVFKHMWQNGKYQFIPFIATVVAVVFTDLLKGVGVGMAVSIFFILRANLKVAYFFKKEQHQAGETIYIDLAQEVSFLNKAAIKQTLMHLPANSKLVINASDSVYIDFDIIHLLKDFINIGSKDKNINVSLIGFKEEYNLSSSHHVTSK
jgi:MFS superfamily sulfate permease-like transporter